MFGSRQGLNLIPNTRNTVQQDDLRQEIGQRIALASSMAAYIGGYGILTGGARALGNLQSDNGGRKNLYPHTTFIVQDIDDESWFFVIPDQTPIDFSNCSLSGQNENRYLFAVIELDPTYVTPAAYGGKFLLNSVQHYGVALQVFDTTEGPDNSIVIGYGQVGSTQGGIRYFQNSFTGENFLQELHVTPGSDTQVIFNDGGTLSGNSNLTFNKSTNVTNISHLNASYLYAGASYASDTTCFANINANFVSIGESGETFAAKITNTRTSASTTSLVGLGVNSVASNTSGTLSAITGLRVTSEVDYPRTVTTEKILEIVQVQPGVSNRTTSYGVYVENISATTAYALFVSGAGNKIGFNGNGGSNGSISQNSASPYDVVVSPCLRTSGALYLGSTNATDQYLYAQANYTCLPAIRYYHNNNVWQFSHGGSSFQWNNFVGSTTDLSDVSETTPENGQVLVYSSIAAKWGPSTPPAPKEYPTWSANQQLTVSDMGTVVYGSGSGPWTVYLPSIADIPIGSWVRIVKMISSTLTIKAPDLDSIADSSQGGTLSNSQVSETFACVDLMACDTNYTTSPMWVITGATGTWTTA